MMITCASLTEPGRGGSQQNAGPRTSVARPGDRCRLRVRRTADEYRLTAIKHNQYRSRSPAAPPTVNAETRRRNDRIHYTYIQYRLYIGRTSSLYDLWAVHTSPRCALLRCAGKNASCVLTSAAALRAAYMCERPVVVFFTWSELNWSSRTPVLNTRFPIQR